MVVARNSIPNYAKGQRQSTAHFCGGMVHRPFLQVARDVTASMRVYTASTTSVAVDESENSMMSDACSLNSHKTSIVDFAARWLCIMPLDYCWIAVQLGPTKMRPSYT